MTPLLPVLVLLATTPLQASTPTPLDGNWTLVQLTQGGQAAQPTPREPGKPPTLNVQGTRLNGFSGCNSFGGEFSVGADSFKAGRLVHTMMACLDAGANSTERTYLGLLGQASRFQVQGDTLTLSTASGDALTFTRAPTP